MHKKLTHEQYEDRLLDKEIDCYPVDKYINMNFPIIHECLYGHQWSAAPGNILRGSGCPDCSGLRKKTHEEYVEEIRRKGIRPIEPYISDRIDILHECKNKHVWSAPPTRVLQGVGCPECAPKGKYNNTYFQNHKHAAQQPGVLYCVVLENKATNIRECIKIGITKGTSFRDVLKRAKNFTGYDYKLLKLVKGTLKEVFELEQELHSQWSHKRCSPSSFFGGHTECFEIDSDIIRSIPKEI